MIEIDYVSQNINGIDKLIAEDIKAIIIPRKGDLINFKSIKHFYLDDSEKDKKFEVVEIEIIPPTRIIIRVFEV